MFEKLFPRPSERRRGRSSISASGLFATVFLALFLAPAVAWASPPTPDERLRAVQDHYDIYTELLGLDNAEHLGVQITAYDAVPSAKWSELELPEVVTLDIDRRIGLRPVWRREESGALILIRTEEQAVTVEDRRFAFEAWEEAGLTFQGVIEHFSEALKPSENSRLIPFAVDVFRVSGAWAGQPLDYRALVLWFVDKRTGVPLFHVIDATFDGIDQLSYLLEMVENPEALVTAPSAELDGGTLGGQTAGSTNLACRETSELIEYRELDRSRIVTDGWPGLSWIRWWDDNLHRSGGHGVDASFSVQCLCSEDCSSSALVRFQNVETWDTGGSTHKIFSCHRWSRDAGKATEVQRKEDGRGAWAAGGVAYATSECPGVWPACGCFLGAVEVGLKLNPNILGNQIGEANIKITSKKPASAREYKGYFSYQCPKCLQLFRVNGRVRGLDRGSSVRLKMTWELGDEEDEQAVTVLHEGDPTGTPYRFPDRIPDEATVRVAAFEPGSGAPDPRCIPKQGFVDGADLTLDIVCDENATDLRVPVPATLLLDGTGGPGFGAGAIGPVEVRMVASPGAGAPAGDTYTVTALERPSVGAEQSDSFDLTFPTPVPVGWTVDFTFDAGEAQDVYCYPNRPATPVEPAMAPVQLTCRARDRPDPCLALRCEDRGWWFDDCDENWLQDDEGYWNDTELGIPSYYDAWTFSITCSDEVGVPGGEASVGSEKSGVGASGGQVLTFRGPSTRLSVPLGSGTTRPELAAGETLRLSGRVSDPQGFENLGFLIDDDPVEALSLTLDGEVFVAELPTASLAAGRHAVSVYAADRHPTHPVPGYVEVAFDVVDGGGCGGDTRGPTLSATPPDGARVPTGAVSLGATASDPSGVDRVAFFVDGEPVGMDWSVPYAATWPATAGTYTVLTRAFDNCGNRTQLRHAVEVCDGGAPPTVDLLTPASGSTLTAGETVTLQAVAGDDFGVDRVQFVKDGGLLIGVDTSPPYAFSWTVEDGVTEIKARAYDGCGQFTVDRHPVQVESACDDAVDAVAFAAPAQGASFIAGQTVTLSATASDARGIAEVRFYAGGTRVGADAAAPYSVTWAAQDGVDQLEARAFDTCGNVRSAWRSVTVAPGCDAVLDAVDLTSPAPGSTLSEGQAVTLRATASDAQGIEKVQFVRPDGSLIGADTAAPYAVTWTAESGVTSLRARAYDTCGNFRADTHAVTVQPSCDARVDAVDLTSPAPGSTLSEGQAVTLTATASDAQGIEKVQFVRPDGSLIGADTTAPYAVTWTAESGVTSLRARAYDTCGNFRADTRAVTVEPSCDAQVDAVTLTAPAAGSTLTAGETVILTATASDAQGIEKVQFVRGDGSLIGADTTAPYSVTWTVESGVTVLKARAYDTCGNFKADANGIVVP
ncbi:MAG: Ig-like domain-containing protein [Acidobacteriota bacterium]